MKFLNIFVIIIILLSCSRKHQGNFDNTEFKKKMQGVWSENLNENALFYIEGDSIYYLDSQDKPLLLTIKGSFFSITFNGYLSKNKIIKLTNDSLIYKTQENDFIRLIRVKE